MPNVCQPRLVLEADFDDVTFPKVSRMALLVRVFQRLFII